MAIQKWKPFGVLGTLQDDINSLFNDFWPARRRRDSIADVFVPDIDVSEDTQNVHIRVDLPGLEEKDVKVNFQNGILTLSGEKKEEKETKERNYHTIERSYGSFSRAVAIPAKVDAAKAKAKFKNGVLSIVMPKMEEAKPKEISIEVE